MTADGGSADRAVAIMTFDKPSNVRQTPVESKSNCTCITTTRLSSQKRKTCAFFVAIPHKFCCYCRIGVEVCRVTHKTASDLDDPSSASLPIGPHCTSGRQCRRQKILPAPWMRPRITWLKTIILDDLKRRKTLSETSLCGREPEMAVRYAALRACHCNSLGGAT